MALPYIMGMGKAMLKKEEIEGKILNETRMINVNVPTRGCPMYLYL